MAHQNLFEALERITGFTALETDMFEIIDAVDKDRAKQNKPIDMEKKQTAVERFAQRLQGRFGNAIIKVMQDDIDISIQLEKQQIVDAHKANAVVYEMDATNQAEQYYNETYNLTEPI